MTDDYELVLAALENPVRFSQEENAALVRVIGHEQAIDGLKDLHWAVAALRHAMPGWWFSVGLCALSGDASIGPDFRAPNAPSKAIIDKYDAGFHADLQPGDGLRRMARALLHCIVQAKQAMKVDGYE